MKLGTGTRHKEGNDDVQKPQKRLDDVIFDFLILTGYGAT